MRKQSLLIVMLLCSSLTFSQNDKDYEIRYNGYDARLILNEDKTYGYEIVKPDKTTIRQAFKPFSTKSIGFRQRQNAMAVAIWHIRELEQGRTGVKNLTVQKAKELYISEDELKDQPKP